MRVIIETLGDFEGVGAIGVLTNRADGNGTSASVTIAGRAFSIETARQIADRLTAAADRALSVAKESEAMSDPTIIRKLVQFDDWQREQVAAIELQRTQNDERAAELDTQAQGLADREEKLAAAVASEAVAVADAAQVDAVTVK